MTIRRSTILLALSLFGVATLLGLVNSAHHYSMMVAAGSPMPWRHAAVMEMPFWYAAALLTPPLVWMLRRFPDQSHGTLKAAQHAALAIGWIVAQTMLEMGARSLIGTGMSSDDAPYFTMVAGSLAGTFPVRLAAYFGVVAVVYALTYHARYRERETTAARLEAQLAATQLQMLRMQLNPHFLFNAMNTVAMLTRAGRSSESVAMLLSLSALMRDALRADAPGSVPLAEELNLVKRYVGVEQVRFGGRLAFDVDVPEPLLGATVPSFLLQPLVENAIRHGRATADGAATIGVSAARRDDTLLLSVWDDGDGVDARASESNGVGLANVRDRLRQIYGAAQSFEIGRDDQRTVARISIPIEFASV